MRERYFAQQDFLTGLGGFASNSWFIASILTVLAGIFMVAIVYIVTHVNGQLAQTQREIRRTDRKVPRLESARENASEAMAQAEHELDNAAATSRSHVVLSLIAANLLEANQAARVRTDKDILEYFQQLWRTLGGEQTPLGDAPAIEPQAGAAARKESGLAESLAEEIRKEENSPIPDGTGGSEADASSL